MSGRRTLFVVGEVPGAATGPLDTLAATCGAVVFADPQSGLRSGRREATVVATADLVTAAGALDRDPPEIVVRWGPIPTSKVVWRWLEDHPGIPQVLVDPGGHRDPVHSARVLMRADVASTASALPWLVEPTDGDWAAGWRRIDDIAAAALTEALESEAFPNEPAIARTVMAAAPAGSLLFVGSSMPIRDIDSFGASRPTVVEILANRGASGIDGTLSTALGATAAEGRPGVVLTGDVAALHDLSALADAVRLRIPLTVVVVHNDGGGIFGLLPQADPERLDPDLFERHIGTPHGVDLVAVAGALGMEATRATTLAELESLVAAGEGPRLVEIRTDRSELADRRRRLAAAVAEALG
jgi:2-succinyl-5-enolpyruvyl-6-hydroxy-3-cyclohexene-1-carboxylate synthase